jgi:hypothetical protein
MGTLVALCFHECPMMQKKEMLLHTQSKINK